LPAIARAEPLAPGASGRHLQSSAVAALCRWTRDDVHREIERIINSFEVVVASAT
jgi:hypothetical protein